ncbi:MAG TPA: hypothetical protein VI279_07535 [Rhodocyclaceae bacterium]
MSRAIDELAREARRRPSRSQQRRRLAQWIAQRFVVRFHVSLILSFSFMAGFAANYAGLMGGLSNPLARYPLALLAGYLGFLLALRLWLGYAGFGRYYQTPGVDGSGLDLGDAADLPGVDSVAEAALAQAGEFGGAGASGDWAVAELPEVSLPEVSLPEIEVPDLGADEGCLVVVLPALVLALVVALVGGLFYYLIYGGPMLLAEAALEGAMAAGFFGSLRRVEDPGWVGGAIRASWKYFLLILGLSMTLAFTLQHYCPQAHTLGAALHGVCSNG